MFVKNRAQRALCAIGCGIVALASLAAGPASAQISKMGAGYLMRLKFTKGAVVSYTMFTTMAMPNGQKQKMEIPYRTQVLNVKGDTATVRYIVGPAKINGVARDEARTIEVTMNNRGKVISGLSTQLQGMAMSLPEKPLKVGESYTSSVKVGEGAQGMNMNTNYKFLGIKTVSGQPAAQFAISSSGTGVVLTSGTGTMSMAVSDGSLLGSTLSQKLITKQGNIKSDVNMVRK